MRDFMKNKLLWLSGALQKKLSDVYRDREKNSHIMKNVHVTISKQGYYCYHSSFQQFLYQLIHMSMSILSQ